MTAGVRTLVARVGRGQLAASSGAALALAAISLVAAGCGGRTAKGVGATTHASAPPVRLAAGPFTDRVAVTGLELLAGERPQIRGRIRNLVDVSDLLVLEIRADFYDAGGRKVATGSWLTTKEEPYHDHALRFIVQSARTAPSAVTGVVSIPQLVTE